MQQDVGVEDGDASGSGVELLDAPVEVVGKASEDALLEIAFRGYQGMRARDRVVNRLDPPVPWGLKALDERNVMRERRPQHALNRGAARGRAVSHGLRRAHVPARSITSRSSGRRLYHRRIVETASNQDSSPEIRASPNSGHPPRGANGVQVLREAQPDGRYVNRRPGVVRRRGEKERISRTEAERARRKLIDGEGKHANCR